MENWDFRKNGKFVCEETMEYEDTWPTCPESAIRVHLTCTSCSPRYRITLPIYASTTSYDGCGLDIPIQDPLIDGQCSYPNCETVLPHNIADCPECGLECRDMSSVIVHSNGCWSFRALRRFIKVRQRNTNTTVSSE